jgi:predicted AlkP superfamily phosphohydrolase/phosphomutase/tetratricopeptide (TPR) repeat protein
LKRILLFVLIAVIAVLALSSIKFVGEGEVRVSGTGEVRRVMAQGAHLVRPFTEVRTYRLSEVHDLTGPAAIRFHAPVGGDLALEGLVEVDIEPGQVLSLDEAYGEGFFGKLVRPLLEREARAFVAEHSGDSQRLLYSPDLLAALSAAVSDNTNEGIRPLGLNLKSLQFSSILRKGDISRRIPREDGLKVFILGLDAFDWLIYEQVARTRGLPNFNRLREKGTWGDLQSIEPLISPLIWTTMVTGVTPDVHGITDFLVRSPDTGEEVPVTSWMRRVPALWNMCTAAGLSSGFIGWFASFPAEEVNGFIVSDRVAYHMFDPAWQKGKRDESAAGLTYPPGLYGEIAGLVRRPEEMTDMVSLYVGGPTGDPGARFDPSDPLSSLRLILSAYTTYEQIMKRVYPRERPDLFGIYFEFTDSVCHLFMRYMDPPMPGTDEEDVRRFKTGVPEAYVEADRILGEVLDMLDDSTVLIVLSDHGFKSGAMRPLTDSRIGHGQAIEWHRIMGSIAFYGPEVKRGHRIVDATVMDIAPTVLYVLGLPIDRKMDGHPLVDAFDDDWVAAREPAYTTLYDSVFVQADATISGSGGEALKQKLVSLGYVSGGESSIINLASFYHKNRRYREAIATWRQVIEDDPDNLGARIGLANAYFEVGREDSAMMYLDEVLAAEPDNFRALISLATIYVKKGNGAKALEVSERAIDVKPDDGDSHFNKAMALELLGRADEAVREYQETVRFAPDHAEAYANLVQIYLSRGRRAEALAAAEKAVGLASGKPEMHYVYGQALESEGDFDGALHQYRLAARLDTLFTPAYLGAGSIMLRQDEPDSALAICEAALRSASQYRDYLYSIKGNAYLDKGLSREAEREFRSALEFNSGFAPARMSLVRLYLSQGRTGEARKELEVILRLDPTNAEARSLLDRVRE